VSVSLSVYCYRFPKTSNDEQADASTHVFFVCSNQQSKIHLTYGCLSEQNRNKKQLRVTDKQLYEIHFTSDSIELENKTYAEAETDNDLARERRGGFVMLVLQRFQSLML